MSKNWSEKDFSQFTPAHWSTGSFATGRPSSLDPRSITPESYMQHASERIQMYQADRDEAGIARMTANEQVAIQDVYRELAGLEPGAYRRFKGGAVPIDRFAEIRQKRTEESPWENFKANIANTVLQSAGGITADVYKISDTLNITDNALKEYSSQLNETMRILAPRGGTSGLMGQVVGSTMFSLLVGGTGPRGLSAGKAWAHGLKVGGVFGLSAAGQTFAEVAQRRMEGQDIGVLNEWTAAIGNGTIEAVTEAFGWMVASKFATKLVQGAPGLRRALATKGWKGAKTWLQHGFKTTAGTVLAQLPQGYLEEFTAQIGQDATNIMTGITPEVDWSDLLGRAHQAGKAGALQPLLLGGGIAAGRLMQQQVHQDTTTGDETTPPQEAGPGRSIDPGEVGPVIEATLAKVTPEVTPEADAATQTREQILDHMVETTPEAERSEITRPAFGANLDTLQYGQEAFVEVNVPIAQLDLNLLGQEETAARRQQAQEYARQPAEAAPAIVAGTITPGGQLTVIDGVRRVQAAQQRGDTIIKALIPQADATAIQEAAPAVPYVAREAEVTKAEIPPPPVEFVEKTVSLVRQRLGREGSKITDDTSLERVGNEIARIVGIPEGTKIVWEFKITPKQRGDSGTHWEIGRNRHRILIRHGEKSFRPKIEYEKRATQAGAKPVAGLEGVVTPSRSSLYRVIIHELGHVVKSPVETKTGRWKVHHPEFVKWVEESIPKLIGIERVEAAATAQETLRSELGTRTPDQKILPPVDEQTLDGNWHTLTDTWIGDRQVADKQADTDAQAKQRQLKDLTRVDETAAELNQAVQIYIDRKNNPDDYTAERIAKQTPIQQAIIQRAQNLIKAQQAFAEQIIQENQDLGLEGFEAGLFASFHENYTARIWKHTKQKWYQPKFTMRTARAKPRSLGSILEGWERGLILAVPGAVEAQQIARKQVAQTIHDRNLVALATKAKLIDTERHEDWKRIEHPNFKKWVYAGKVEEGKVYGRGVYTAPDGSVFRETPLYAEPKLARFLNNALGASRLYDIPGVGAITKYNAIIKSTVLMTGLFHHQAFLRSYMLASRGINPATAWREGKKAAEEFGPELQLLVHEGLTYGLVQDFQLSAVQEQTKIGEVVDKVPMAKECKDLLTRIRDHQVNFLFGKMGPYLKVQAALLEYQARIKANKNKLIDGRITHREIAHAVAEELNFDFGGLNLPRMGRNPTTQHIFHLLALAPDWTESNIRSAVAAFQRGEIGAVHRLMWGRIALKGMGTIILSNLLLAGFDDDDFWTRYQKAWKAGHLRWLDVDVTPVYRKLGGKDRKRKYFNLLGHFRDPIRFAVHPVKAAKGKSSIIGRMVWEGLSGTDWSGRTFTDMGDLVKKGRVTEKRMFGGGPIRPKQVPSYIVWQGKQSLPIQAQSLIDWQRGQIDGWDATMQSLGIMGGTTYPPKVRRLKRKRR